MIRKIMASFFLLLSVSYLYFALQLNFGTMLKPLSGFLPILVGALASLLALIDFIGVFKMKNENAEEPAHLKIIFLVALGFVAYIFLLKHIPYLIATFVILCYLLKVARIKGWIVPFSVSACTAFAFYLVFDYMLNVPFP